MEMSSEVLIALIGMVGGLLTLVVQHVLQKPPASGAETPRRDWRLLRWIPTYLLVGLIAGITVGTLLARGDAGPEVRILNPAAGARVPMEEMIRGSSSRLPDGDSVWTVVYVPSAGRYYPQDRPVDMQAHGGWNSLARIGVAGDSGVQFDVVAVSANGAARQEFRWYLERSRRAGKWEGLPALPVGATEFHRVSVRRQP